MLSYHCALFRSFKPQATLAAGEVDVGVVAVDVAGAAPMSALTSSDCCRLSKVCDAWFRSSCS